MIALAFDRGETGAVRLCVWAMAIRAVRGDLSRPGMVWPYSPLGMAAFAVIRFDAAASALGKRALSPAREKGAWRGGGLRGQPCLGVFCTTPERVSARRGYRQSGAGHVRRMHVEPGKTMLQHTAIWTAACIWRRRRPAGRFFAQLNVNLDEMNEEMDRYLREGIPDYVVVDWNRLPAEFDRYEEICALTSYDDSNRYIKSMIL